MKAFLKAERFENGVSGQHLGIDRGYLVDEEGDTAHCADCTETVMGYVEEDGLWLECECDCGYVSVSGSDDESVEVTLR